jgi:predicted CXXCH cytochrome family protein
MMTINFVSAQEYLGAESCMGCHPEQYEGWTQTRHAQAAGMTEEGTFWVSDPDDPSRNRGDLDAWKDSCANCHVLNWDAETKTFEFSETDPEKGLNIQCEECHGPGMTMEVDRTPQLCEECHTDSHSQVADYYVNDGHSASYDTLQTSDHAGDSCLHCMTTQAFLGDEVAYGDEGLTSISCVVCHDLHAGEHETMLRTEEEQDLCGECHIGSHHPQSEEAVYPSGPHAKSDVDCTDCHGAGTHFAHGHESAWFNHSFAIYGIYYPYNQTEPLACANCHELEWAVDQMEVIETTTATMVESAEEIFEMAYTVIENADLTEAEATELTETVDAAAATVHYWVADASGGLHNPEGGYAAISAAAHAANEAALEALEAANEELESEVSTLASEKTTLESEVSSLETQVTSLESQVEELENQGGIPGFPVSSVALGILMSAAVIFYITKPKVVA